MKTVQERITLLGKALFRRDDICSSEGSISSFPILFHTPIFGQWGGNNDLYAKGFLLLPLNRCVMRASAGETLFIPDGAEFRVMEESSDLDVHFLLYQVEPIRDILGNQVVSMYLYSQLVPKPCYVWQTGEEDELLRYMMQLDATLLQNDTFRQYEQKLLLLALTHRLCSLYNRKLMNNQNAMGHRNEVFLKLISLIEQYYMQERGVEFYADKLCLSPKYLSVICQINMRIYSKGFWCLSPLYGRVFLLFKKIHRKNIQEIADMFNFPNASFFWNFLQKANGHVSWTISQEHHFLIRLHYG